MLKRLYFVLGFMLALLPGLEAQDGDLQYSLVDSMKIQTQPFQEAEIHATYESFMTHCQQKDSLGVYWSGIKQAGRFLSQEQPELALILIERSYNFVWRKPDSNVEWKEYADVVLNHGYILETYSQDFLYAKDLFFEGYLIHRDQLKKNHLSSFIFALHSLANVYTRFGDYAKAEAYFNIMINEILERNPQDPYLPSSYVDLAVVQLSKNDDKAALKTLNFVHVDGPAGNYANLLRARVLLSLERYDEAEKHLVQAQKEIKLLIPQVYLRPTILERNSDVNKFFSILYLHKRNFPKALKYAKLALDYNPDKFGRSKGKLHNHIAKVYLEKGDFHLAQQHLDSALTSILPSYQGEIIKNELYAENTILENLDIRADLDVNRFRQTNAISFLKNALHYRDLAFLVELKLRQQYDFDDSKEILQKESKDRCAKSISICNDLFILTLQEKYIHKAFLLAEQNKATLLYESILEKQSEQLIKKESLLFEQIKTQEIWVNYLSRRIIESDWNYKEDSGDLNKIILQKKEAELHLKELKSKAKNYDTVDVPFLTDSFTVNLISKLQEDDITLIEYFIQDNEMYRFVASGSSIKMKTIPLSMEWKNRIDSLRKIIVQPFQYKSEYTFFQNVSYNLYDKLMGDVSFSDRTIFIQDDVLFGLPFEALMITNTSYGSLLNTQYLIHKTAVSYQYSAKVFLNEKVEKESIALESVFYIAPIHFSDLQWSTLESNNRHFKKEIPQLSFNCMLNEDANVHYFLTKVETHDIIHINSHAVASDQPKIILSDGNIYSHDIETLNLKAKLVVLSACQTGVGEISQTEGPMSLARSFAYAGAPSTVMSLWTVNEGATLEILTSFYSYINEGLPKDVALKNAKLNYLKNARGQRLSPYFWSGISLLGSTQPLLIEQNNRWSIWLLPLFIVFLVVIRKVVISRKSIIES